MVKAAKRLLLDGRSILGGRLIQGGRMIPGGCLIVSSFLLLDGRSILSGRSIKGGHLMQWSLVIALYTGRPLRIRTFRVVVCCLVPTLHMLQA